MAQPIERHVAVAGARLYSREVGEGPPVVVLHGGPDFDHRYLLPELDRLSDSLRLVYYDQRGRGGSAWNVRPEDVTIASEVADLDELRRQLHLESVALLGHSWGGLLAMEYAARHPEHVSHLILMNTAPGSAVDWQVMRDHVHRLRTPTEREQLQAIMASDAFCFGDIAAEQAYYRVHFRPALAAEFVEPVVERLRGHWDPAGVRLARAIEDRLYSETVSSPDYDLLPRLARVDIPTLVLHGKQDFIPVAVAAHIAEAIPAAVLAVLPGCRHFAYLEAPEQVHRHIAALFGR